MPLWLRIWLFEIEFGRDKHRKGLRVLGFRSFLFIKCGGPICWPYVVQIYILLIGPLCVCTFVGPNRSYLSRFDLGSSAQFKLVPKWSPEHNFIMHGLNKRNWAMEFRSMVVGLVYICQKLLTFCFCLILKKKINKTNLRENY